MFVLVLAGCVVGTKSVMPQGTALMRDSSSYGHVVPSEDKYLPHFYEKKLRSFPLEGWFVFSHLQATEIT